MQRYIDLESLPEEARKELVEFYEYLKNKHKQRKICNTMNDIGIEIMADQIQIDTKGWIFKREEIYER